MRHRLFYCLPSRCLKMGLHVTILWHVDQLLGNELYNGRHYATVRKQQQRNCVFRARCKQGEVVELSQLVGK
jgi:hypothetical protein